MPNVPSRPSARRGAGGTDDRGTWSDGDGQALQNNKRSWPDFQSNSRRAHTKQASRESLRKSDEQFRTVRPRASFGQVAAHRAELDREAAVTVPEVDELEERDDLKCWLTRTIS